MSTAVKLETIGWDGESPEEDFRALLPHDGWIEFSDGNPAVTFKTVHTTASAFSPTKGQQVHIVTFDNDERIFRVLRHPTLDEYLGLTPVPKPT